MGFDLIKIKFLINTDKSFGHVGHYNIKGELGLNKKKPAESSILILSVCPGRNPAGLSQWMISVGSNLFIPPKCSFSKGHVYLFLIRFENNYARWISNNTLSYAN